MIELSGGAAVLAAVLIFLTLLRVSALEKRVATLSRIDGKLDALLKHSQIEYKPYEGLADDVVQALQRGEKLQAIKHYRDATGVGLKAAKEFIEEVQRRM